MTWSPAADLPYGANEVSLVWDASIDKMASLIGGILYYRESSGWVAAPSAGELPRSSFFSFGYDPLRQKLVVTNGPNLWEWGRCVVQRDASPVISSISPSTASVNGGSEAVIVGSGFSPGLVVHIGSTPARVLAMNGSSEIVVAVPPGPAPGPAEVTVYNPDAQRASLVDGLQYTSAGPAVSGVVATVTSITTARITWSPLSGASRYEIWRSSHGNPFALRASTSTAVSRAMISVRFGPASTWQWWQAWLQSLPTLT